MTDRRGVSGAGVAGGVAGREAPVGSAAPEPTSDSRVPWRAIRIAAGVVWLAALVVITVLGGVPTSRRVIAALIVSALMITRLGAGWRALGRVLLDWLPFTLVLIAYDETRGFADTVGLPLHVSDVVGWERDLFDGTVPTVWLQQHLYHPGHVYWYDALCTLIYTSHFLATPVLAAVLWLRDRAQWIRFITRVIVLSVAGLLTYVLFPEAPPWYASRVGAIAQPVARLSARGWAWFHIGNLQDLLAHAQQDGANPVAAMPSLHVAFATLVALFAIERLRSRRRLLLVLYPVAMGFALVYLGEHYVVDLIAGVVYALATHWLVGVAERRWAARRQGRLAGLAA